MTNTRPNRNLNVYRIVYNVITLDVEGVVGNYFVEAELQKYQFPNIILMKLDHQLNTASATSDSFEMLPAFRTFFFEKVLKEPIVSHIALVLNSYYLFVTQLKICIQMTTDKAASDGAKHFFVNNI